MAVTSKSDAKRMLILLISKSLQTKHREKIIASITKMLLRRAYFAKRLLILLKIFDHIISFM